MLDIFSARHRHAIGELLVEPQQTHHERGAAEICKSEIGCDDGGGACRLTGWRLSVNDVVEHVQTFGWPSPRTRNVA
jgi:hypothetical protein